MAQRCEQVFVQALFAYPCVRGFDKTVPRRLARRDPVPADLAIFLPLEDRAAGQFGAVVADQQAGKGSQLCNAIQSAGNARTAKGCAHDGGKAFAAEVINHVQHAEAAVTLKSI